MSRLLMKLVMGLCKIHFPIAAGSYRVLLHGATIEPQILPKVGIY